jgi:glucose-6-phosphate 1-dehydrogenase
VEFSRRAPDAPLLDGLLSRLRYVGSSFDDAAGYVELGHLMDELDSTAGRPLIRLYSCRPRRSTSA